MSLAQSRTEAAALRYLHNEKGPAHATPGQLCTRWKYDDLYPRSFCSRPMDDGTCDWAESELSS